MNIFKKVNFTNTKEKINFNNNFILGKDETLLPKFTRIFGTKYSVNIYYLRTEKPELYLTENCINIHLPMNYRKRNNQDLLDVIIVKMYTKIAENEIENIMEKEIHTFGFAPEDYEIQKMASTLASCDKDTQSISINPYLVMYSKEIVEYVVFHQFCHLKYKTHSKKFNEMISQYINDLEKYSRMANNISF